MTKQTEAQRITRHIDEAASAMAALYVMDAVASMLEGGVIEGGKTGAAKSADRIIATAMAERTRQFKRYTKAREAITKGTK